jgi:drug/metabolite transporter (DMT)-like permease
MFFLAVYLALARRNKSTGLWSYVFPLYVAGAISSFLISLVFVNPLTEDWSLSELLPLALLAIIPTMIGHSVSNWAMRRFHPQLVSIVMVTQFVWAAILAWLFFGEIPPLLFYPASAVVMTGCAIAIVPGLPKRKSRDIKPGVAELRD